MDNALPIKTKKTLPHQKGYPQRRYDSSLGYHLDKILTFSLIWPKQSDEQPK